MEYIYHWYWLFSSHLATTYYMYLYYMNVDDKYALYRYSTADGSNEKLTSDRVDVFNVYGNSIFYQKNDYNRSSNKNNQFFVPVYTKYLA